MTELPNQFTQINVGAGLVISSLVLNDIYDSLRGVAIPAPTYAQSLLMSQFYDQFYVLTPLSIAISSRLMHAKIKIMP
ncbi:hypothetical protein NIES3585_29960 [Nodularia sp. NIES-3585]|nr:hypothetical protein NIES3585_29960 [Nodularia sp. NIES-3585]